MTAAGRVVLDANRLDAVPVGKLMVASSRVVYESDLIVRAGVS